MHRFTRDEAELNLAPMLDVVLLLLCFFILTARFGDAPEQINALDLELPAANSEQALSPQALLLDMAADGQIVFAGERFQTANVRLAEVLTARAAQQQDVVIRADTATPHGLVIELMDLAGSLGYSKLRVASKAATP